MHSTVKNGWAVIVAIGASALLTACPPPYPKCDSDDNCKEQKEVCVNGMCQECATNANCKPGFMCAANRCVPKPECDATTSCAAGKNCVDGRCIEAPIAECSTNEDCPAGKACSGGNCIVATASDTACHFEPIYFSLDEYVLNADDEAKLDDYAKCIKNASLRFTLEGNADERGTEEYNMVLSQRRAASVKKFLTNLGVPSGNLDTVGYGKLRPAKEGHDEQAWSANRRVEFQAR